MSVPAQLRREVVSRAQNRCEYCCLPQAGQEALFHVDHVIPSAAGGVTALDNLALACVSCSLRKGARQTAPDPNTGEMVPLFSPRADRWTKHFGWDGIHIVGLSATGRATVIALKFNRSLGLAVRQEAALRQQLTRPKE
jgi:hypothetical protein